MPSPADLPAWVTATRLEAPPVPDGQLVVHTVWGQTHVYPYKDMAPNNGWRPQSHYLSVATQHGRVNWPWHSILNFETHHNSPEYAEAKRAWDLQNAEA